MFGAISFCSNFQCSTIHLLLRDISMLSVTFCNSSSQAKNCYFLSDIPFVVLPRIFRRFWRLVLSSAGVPRRNCQVNALTNCPANTFPKKLPSLIHSLSSAAKRWHFCHLIHVAANLSTFLNFLYLYRHATYTSKIKQM